MLSIDSEMRVETIFSYDHPFSFSGDDVQQMPNGDFVVVGSFTTPFDLRSDDRIDISELISRDLRQSPFEFWTGYNDRETAFVMQIRGRSLVGGRVFTDPLASYLIGVDYLTKNLVVAVGMANGGDEWVIALRLLN